MPNSLGSLGQAWIAILLCVFASGDQNAADGENGALSEPTAKVGAYVRMTCCGSIHFPTVVKESSGSYLINDVRLGIGEWQIFVQLKNTETESQFVTVKLDE